jgi:hypothetical protein
MFLLRPPAQWSAEKNGHKANDYFVDLTGAENASQVAKLTSRVLRSKDWSDQEAGNLDALMEHIWSFYSENWGHITGIHVLVPSSLTKLDTLLPLKLGFVFCSGFVNAISEKLHDPELSIENLRKPKLFIYLN